MSKPLVKLENWEIGFPGCGPYTPPELWIPVLVGDVHGHPNFANGSNVVVGELIACTGRRVESKNSMYELAHPSQGYREYCEGIGSTSDLDTPDLKNIPFFSALPDIQTEVEEPVTVVEEV